MTPKRAKVCRYCDFSQAIEHNGKQVFRCNSVSAHAKKHMLEADLLIVDEYDKACRFYRTCLRKLPYNKKYGFKDKIDA